MNRQRVVSIMIVLAFLFSSPRPVLAKWSLPSWLGGNPEKVSSAHRTKPPAKPSTAASKGKSKNLFTSTKNAFKPHSKSKGSSKWAPGTPSKSHTKPKAEKESWMGSLFKPKEPEPPRSIEQWMDLKQIKP